MTSLLSQNRAASGAVGTKHLSMSGKQQVKSKFTNLAYVGASGEGWMGAGVADGDSVFHPVREFAEQFVARFEESEVGNLVVRQNSVVNLHLNYNFIISRERFMKYQSKIPLW